MFTPGISEELERPDDFHDEEAGRRSRGIKLPARSLVAHRIRRGRLEVGERTRKQAGAAWYESATEKDSAIGRASGVGASQ
jgi:hypothetical protein